MNFSHLCISNHEHFKIHELLLNVMNFMKIVNNLKFMKGRAVCSSGRAICFSRHSIFKKLIFDFQNLCFFYIVTDLCHKLAWYLIICPFKKNSFRDTVTLLYFSFQIGVTFAARRRLEEVNAIFCAPVDPHDVRA